MKAILPLCLLLAFTGLAHAQSQVQDKPPAPEKKPVPNLNKSPWSVDTNVTDEGLTGTSNTVIKRDMGDGWSIGGQMSTPYADQKIGGSGAPGLERYQSPSSNTLFGPYLEKKF
jgi:hypothetical protein